MTMSHRTTAWRSHSSTMGPWRCAIPLGPAVRSCGSRVVSGRRSPPACVPASSTAEEPSRSESSSRRPVGSICLPYDWRYLFDRIRCTTEHLRHRRCGVGHLPAPSGDRHLRRLRTALNVRRCSRPLPDRRETVGRDEEDKNLDKNDDDGGRHRDEDNTGDGSRDRPIPPPPDPNKHDR